MQNDNKQELLDCPFCGSEDIHLHRVTHSNNGYYVQCWNCDTKICLCATEKLAIQTWQARAKPLPDETYWKSKYGYVKEGLERAQNKCLIYAPGIANEIEQWFSDEDIFCRKSQPAPLPSNKEVGELVEMIDFHILGLATTKPVLTRVLEQCKTALLNAQPPATGDDVVERVARAITAYRYDTYEKPTGNTQCKSEYVGYLWTRWENEAKAAIAALQKAQPERGE